MHSKTLHKLEASHSIEDLHKAVQQAIEIEITTIPLYLYTYYSINRVPKQEDIITYYTKKLMDNGASEKKACKKAKELSVKIMVFANKAAATIMSVVVEEMLHMALSSNLQRGLGAMPRIAGRAPKSFPTMLPGHAKVQDDDGRFVDFKAPLAPLSVRQLEVFIKIEKPETGSIEIGEEYTSIGEFYNSIIDYIEENKANIKFDKKSPQVYPDQEYNRNGYYAPNNVNTIYYDENHKAQFTNANPSEKKDDHSGHLIKVTNVESAINAIEEIIEQGEGSTEELEGEESHYIKFKNLRKELKAYRGYLKDNMKIPKEELTDEYENLLSFFIHPVPKDPKTADFPEDLQALSNYTNALYTYHFHMTEACYRFDNPKQGAIMLYGLHKSMFFILSIICSFMMTKTYRDAEGNLKRAAPTFEDYEFKAGKSIKAQLIELNKKVPAHLGMTPNQLERISVLPDVDIVPMENMRF